MTTQKFSPLVESALTKIENMESSTPKRKAGGRPKGSKNKKTDNVYQLETVSRYEIETGVSRGTKKTAVKKTSPFPYEQMKLDQSFFYPKKDARRAGQARRQVEKTTKMRFHKDVATKGRVKGFRVWRVK